MYEKFVLTDFKDKNKWGLPGYFEVLCEHAAIKGTCGLIYKTTLNFDTIKLGISFPGMLEDCDAIFDDGKFKRLRFSFYNKANGAMLWIFYEDVKGENHLELNDIVYRYERNINEKVICNFNVGLDEKLLKLLMLSKHYKGPELKELLPELSVVGVYDFTSVEFNQRLTVANMLTI